MGSTFCQICLITRISAGNGNADLENYCRGGRFPSTLNINRDSQVPHSPSSPSSSDDRENLAATSALPGSGVPFGHSGKQVQAGDDETNTARGQLGGASGAPLHTDKFSPTAHQQQYDNVAPQHSNLPTAVDAEYSHSPVPAEGVSSDGLGAVTYGQWQQPSLPHHIERHDSKYGDWMPGAAGGAVLGAAGMEAYRHNQGQKRRVSQDEQPGSQPVEVAGHTQQQVAQPVHGAISAAMPSSTSTGHNTASSTSQGTSKTTHGSTVDPAAPIKDLADRPLLESHSSVVTVSELHVPGEFPRGSIVREG